MVDEDGEIEPVGYSQALLADGSLGLHVAADVAETVAPWRPRLPEEFATLRADAASLVVRRGPAVRALPDAAPLLELRRLRVWMLPSGTHALLADTAGHLSAEVDLDARRATVHIPDPQRAAAEAAVEVFAALSVASALLLTRLGRALVHAAAVVVPGGGALLFAGGTFSGKTTTCLTLARVGWEWLSDDHVVLGDDGAGGVSVAGWPRRFNLDTGPAGRPAGVRMRGDPPAGWRASAAAGALVFSRIEAALPTALEPVAPAAALGMLLDQSPWLLADRAGARPVLALLQCAARLPAFALRLGLDSHHDPAVLRTALAPAAEAARRVGGAPSPGADGAPARELDRAAETTYPHMPQAAGPAPHPPCRYLIPRKTEDQ
jgi:hypothetical protein